MRSVLVVLAIAGCYKEKAAVVPPPANKVASPAHDVSNDVLAFLPRDSELVIGLDGVELRRAALYTSFEDELMQGISSKLAHARQCGLDPKTVEGFTAGGKVIGGGEQFEGVFVVRGVDSARALTCMAKEGAAKGTVTNEGGVVTLQTNDHQDVAVTAAGARTLVMQFGHGVNKDSIGALLALGSPLRTSPAFMTLFERREPHAAMWFMINGSAPFMAELRKNGISPRSVDGTLRVTDQLAGALRVSFASPADADSLVQMTHQVQGYVQAMVERFDVRADGAVVHVEAAATEAQLRALAALFGKFAP
jgi:hypothetical protein